MPRVRQGRIDRATHVRKRRLGEKAEAGRHCANGQLDQGLFVGRRRAGPGPESLDQRSHIGVVTREHMPAQQRSRGCRASACTASHASRRLVLSHH
jgi:hypothetical protein